MAQNSLFVFRIPVSRGISQACGPGEPHHRRVPAESGLFRGICAWFLQGNFSHSRERDVCISGHLHSGFRIFPQADTACLAAREQFAAGKAERQGNSSDAPYISELFGCFLRVCRATGICGVKHAEKSQDNAQGESFCPKNLNVSHRRGF